MEVVAELIKHGANVDAATKVCAAQESRGHTPNASMHTHMRAIVLLRQLVRQ